MREFRNDLHFHARKLLQLFLSNLIADYFCFSFDVENEPSQAQVHRGARRPEGAFEPAGECRLWNRRLAEAHRFLDQTGQ